MVSLWKPCDYRPPMRCSALSIKRWMASRRYLTLAPIFKKSGGWRNSLRRRIAATETLRSLATSCSVRRDLQEKCAWLSCNPFVVAVLPTQDKDSALWLFSVGSEFPLISFYFHLLLNLLEDIVER